MKRTTLYLPPDIEVRLKLEGQRRGQPMAELVREAVVAYLSVDQPSGPPGAGAFASGHKDTADRAEALLGELGFGEDAKPRTRKRVVRKRRAGRRA
jgi:hypothetical protein